MDLEQYEEAIKTKLNSFMEDLRTDIKWSDYYVRTNEDAMYNEVKAEVLEEVLSTFKSEFSEYL